MKIEQAKVGTRVRSNVEFSGVPAFTEGVIVENYGTGIMVEWDLPDKQAKPLRDGFDKKKELQFLDVCLTPPPRPSDKL